ncbi:MAG: cadherin-like beta sandwich domain-containing protein [Spirochaetales bacterium]|nr:cadherin-like beta sandwich domain-containing protein [Spirochaetales bacterium]
MGKKNYPPQRDFTYEPVGLLTNVSRRRLCDFREDPKTHYSGRLGLNLAGHCGNGLAPSATGFYITPYAPGACLPPEKNKNPEKSGAKSQKAQKFSFSLFMLLAAFCPLTLLPGCDLLANSPMEFIEEHTGVATATGWSGRRLPEGQTPVTRPDGAVAIPPGDSLIAVRLHNPRNYSLSLELLYSGTPGSAACTAVQESSDTVLITITGAALDDEYHLTLILKSPDRLREFQPYTLPALRCLSFTAALADIQIDGGAIDLSPSFDGAAAEYTAGVSEAVTAVTIAGTLLDSSASLTLNAQPAGDAEDVVCPLDAAINIFTLRVRAQNGVSFKDYRITVYRGDPASLLAFYFSIDGKTYGFGAGTQSGSGSINGTDITISLPYGTDVSSLSPVITIFPGAAINPAPGTVDDFTNSKTYAVSGGEGSTRTYTVTVKAQGQGAVGFTFTGPADESIDLSDQVLVWKDDTPLNLLASGPYASWQWYLDGAAMSGETSAGLNMSARDFSAGKHTISVRVEKDGRLYSKEAVISVEGL